MKLKKLFIPLSLALIVLISMINCFKKTDPLSGLSESALSLLKHERSEIKKVTGRTVELSLMDKMYFNALYRGDDLETVEKLFYRYSDCQTSKVGRAGDLTLKYNFNDHPIISMISTHHKVITLRFQNSILIDKHLE